MEVVSYLGSLVQSCCGEGGALQQMSLACAGSTQKCSGHTGFAPAHGVCAFPVYTAQAPGCSAGSGALHCVHFLGLSCSGSGSRVLHKGPKSVGPAFCAFPVRAAQATRSLMSALSPGAVRLIPSVVPASVSRRAGRFTLCLFWAADFWLRPSQ